MLSWIPYMTRPPFAEFSSLAIRELTAWMRRRAPWPARLDAVVSVVPGHGVTVRDLLADGDPVEVIEVSRSRQLVRLMLFRHGVEIRQRLARETAHHC
jgi:hypothetical protein